MFILLVQRVQRGFGQRKQGDQRCHNLKEDLPRSSKSPRHKTKEAQDKRHEETKNSPQHRASDVSGDTLNGNYD